MKNDYQPRLTRCEWTKIEPGSIRSWWVG